MSRLPSPIQSLLPTLALCALGPVLLGACSGPEPKPQPRAEPAPIAPEPEPESQARVATIDDQSRLPPGHMLFVVQDADLTSDVLPLFREQAGLDIRYRGEPKKISLKLTEPTPWETALDLVLMFSKTHLTRDYQGRWIMKPPYGRLKPDDRITLDELTANGTRGTASTSGGRRSSGSRGGATASRSGSSSGSTSGSEPKGYTSNDNKPSFGDQDAYSGGEEARGLLKGVGTTNSGPR